MMEKPTILERLEYFAVEGETSAPLKLWKSQIQRLNKEGFIVYVLTETNRKGEYFCEISWKNPLLSGGDAEKLLMFTINTLNKNISDSKRAKLPPEYEECQVKSPSLDDIKYRSPYY